MTPHWVLQNDLYAEEGWNALVGALERLGFPYSVHKCVPFTGTLDPEPLPIDAPVIVMGSYSMARHANTHGWKPGAWLDNLDFRIQREHWGDLMLNADAACTTIEDFAGPIPRPCFVRPVHDTKGFTGSVFDDPSWQEFRDGVIAVADDVSRPTVTPRDDIMICTAKEIWSETRTWVVDGRVVTTSGYKVGTIKRYTSPHQVDERITAFAQACTDRWRPNPAFVLDVADTPAGLKIVEINNLNAAGLYRGDMQKLVVALADLAEASYL
jgi:hypothetical protein